MASRRCHSIGLIGSTLFRHRLWKACSKRCPDWRWDAAVGGNKGLTTLLAERHARHLAGRAQTLQDARKPMHTDPSTI